MGRFAHAATRLHVRAHEHRDPVWAGELQICFGVGCDSLSNVGPSSIFDEHNTLKGRRNLFFL